MKKSKVYVLHVGARQERRTMDSIRRLISSNMYDEVFSPKFEKRIKHAGEWRTVEALLAPGYLFISTADIQRLREALLSVPAFTKLLGLGAEAVPLESEDVSWIEQLTEPQARTVAFSTGFITGDQVVITGGPLRGHESEIVKIDRRKRFAYLAFRIMGREKPIKVGLEIVSKVSGMYDR